jgi:hypothetical protein
MREAVIVSTARTPIGKAYRGAFNDTQAQQLGAHAVRHAVERAGVDPAEIEDVVMGAALQQGSTGTNVARQIAMAAGFPTVVSGMSLDRQCASGLMAIATAAKQVIVDGMPITVGGGLESISLVQNGHMNMFRAADADLLKLQPHMYMSMLETAEVVSARYGISRDAQDEYALQSQQRTAAAQAEGRFDAEIVPMTTTMQVLDKTTGETSHVQRLGDGRIGQFALQHVQAARQVRVLLQRFQAVVGQGQAEGQGGVVEGFRRGARGGARHVGDAVVDDIVDHIGRVFVGRGVAGLETAALVDGDVDQHRAGLHLLQVFALDQLGRLGPGPARRR